MKGAKVIKQSRNPYAWVYLLSGLLIFAAFTRPVIGGMGSGGIKTIVIDAGHGGKDPGCNGAGTVFEKDVTLSVALKLGKLIEDSLKDVKVVYTRKTDEFIELWERPSIANKNNADLFISIHCNANPSKEAAGTETYVMGLHKTEGNLNVAKRENSSIKFEENYQTNENYGGFDPNSPESHIIFSLLQNAFLDQSLKVATKVETHINSAGKLKSRGVKQAGFLVLWKTAMPAVLIETGFLTNAEDRKVLASADGQKSMALSIFKAVRQHKKELESAKATGQKTAGK